MGTFFFKNPVGKFLFDLGAGAVIGAGLATLALPGDASTHQAFGAILGGAQGAIRSVASTALVGAIRTLRGDS